MSTRNPLDHQYIIKVLNDKIADDAVISLDVGENCWWFGRNFRMKKTQKLVMSGTLATMGFGLPGALAAALAYPETADCLYNWRWRLNDGSGRLLNCAEVQVAREGLCHEQQAAWDDYAGAES